MPSLTVCTPIEFLANAGAMAFVAIFSVLTRFSKRAPFNQRIGVLADGMPLPPITGASTDLTERPVAIVRGDIANWDNNVVASPASCRRCLDDHC